MKLHIHIQTEDLFWAICFAGALKSAKSDRSGVNPRFSFSFEPTTDSIAVLSKYFDKRPDVFIPLESPKTEEELLALDLFANKRKMLEIQEIHGVIPDPNLISVENGTSTLAAELILLRFNLVGKSSFFYPMFSKDELKPYEQYQGVCSSNVRPHLEQFLKGRGMDNPNILELDGLPALERIKASCGPNLKGITVGPDDDILAVHRSYYKDYDHLTGSTPILLVVPEGYEFSSRHELNWAGLIPVVENLEYAGCESKGAGWEIRERSDHNVQNYLKELAEKKKAVAVGNE